MAAPPVKKPRKSLTQLGRERKQRITASHFDPKYIGEGGPVYIYQQCGFTTQAFRDNYDGIKWDSPQS